MSVILGKDFLVSIILHPHKMGKVNHLRGNYTHGVTGSNLGVDLEVDPWVYNLGYRLIGQAL